VAARETYPQPIQPGRPEGGSDTGPAGIAESQVPESLASGRAGSKSSTGLPDGSSAMICLPPTDTDRGHLGLPSR
jgi:hypothetical protein